MITLSTSVYLHVFICMRKRTVWKWCCSSVSINTFTLPLVSYEISTSCSERLWNLTDVPLRNLTHNSQPTWSSRRDPNCMVYCSACREGNWPHADTDLQPSIGEHSIRRPLHVLIKTQHDVKRKLRKATTGWMGPRSEGGNFEQEVQPHVHKTHKGFMIDIRGGVLIRKPEIKPRSSDARVEDEKQDQPQPLTNGRVVREIQLEPKILHSIEIVSPSVSEAPCKFYALRSFFFAVWYCGKAIGRRSADCIAYGVKGRRPSKISPEQCLTQRADIGLKRRRARSRYAGCDDTLDQCLPLTHSNRKLTGLSRDAKRSWNLSEGFGWCKPLHSEK